VIGAPSIVMRTRSPNARAIEAGGATGGGAVGQTKSADSDVSLGSVSI